MCSGSPLYQASGSAVITRSAGLSVGRRTTSATSLREPRVGTLEPLAERHGVEHGEAIDRARMVEREPHRDIRAAVVTDDREALVAERAHQSDEVAGHRPLGVGGISGVDGGFDDSP